MISLTRSIAQYYAPQGVRANVLMPGAIETAMTREAFTDAAYRAASERMTVLGRIGRPEEVATAALYLASDESSFVTGSYPLGGRRLDDRASTGGVSCRLGGRPTPWHMRGGTRSASRPGHVRRPVRRECPVRRRRAPHERPRRHPALVGRREIEAMCRSWLAGTPRSSTTCSTSSEGHDGRRPLAVPGRGSRARRRPWLTCCTARSSMPACSSTASASTGGSAVS